MIHEESIELLHDVDLVDETEEPEQANVAIPNRFADRRVPFS